MTLIDTAEMYGEGGAEEVVGEAIAGRRDEVFVVSKVYPHNASRAGAVAACERSLQRLRTDRIDLYLLHWRGAHPARRDDRGVRDAAAGRQDPPLGRQQFRHRRHAGAGGAAGRQDVRDQPGALQPRPAAASSGTCCRGAASVGIPVMAYSPLDESRLITDRRLVRFAEAAAMSPAQAALAWLMSSDDVIVIPKSADPERLAENIAALDKTLSPVQLTELDRLFPPPKGPVALEMI